MAIESAATSWPGIFSLGQNGQGQGAILIGGTALFAGEVPGVASRPARRGEALEIYCTGLGRVAGTPLLTTVETPTVTMGGVRAEVLFSGLAPGFVGVYQVNARVPVSAGAGPRVPVVIRMGEAGPSSNTVTIGVAGD